MRSAEDADPFDDPVWQRAEEMAGALPRPAKGYVACPLAWLGRVLPVGFSAEQLFVAQMLYRRGPLTRRRSVPLPERGRGQIQNRPANQKPEPGPFGGGR